MEDMKMEVIAEIRKDQLDLLNEIVFHPQTREIDENKKNSVLFLGELAQKIEYGNGNPFEIMLLIRKYQKMIITSMFMKYLA